MGFGNKVFMDIDDGETELLTGNIEMRIIGDSLER